MTSAKNAHASLWYYEGRPDQYCELVSSEGESLTLRPLDGSPEFTCNGSFAWQQGEQREM